MLTGGSRLGRFLIRDLIDASGATSSVYRAEDERGQELALKVLDLEFDERPDLLGRFLSEARVILRRGLAHPGLPRVVAVEVPSVGPPYIAMELLGATLAAELRRAGRLPVATALQIAAQLAEVLAYLHEQGIIHRDVKPDNVVFAPGPGVQVKLIDLGQAKLPAADERAGALVSTALGSRCGTPAYRAPEQWHDAKTVSDRADVYSLGVMLYEVLAGAPPFPDGDPGALRLAHATADPPPLPASAALSTLYQAMLEKRPADRPSAAAVARTLRALLTR